MSKNKYNQASHAWFFCASSRSKVNYRVGLLLLAQNLSNINALLQIENTPTFGVCSFFYTSTLIKVNFPQIHGSLSPSSKAPNIHALLQIENTPTFGVCSFFYTSTLIKVNFPQIHGSLSPSSKAPNIHALLQIENTPTFGVCSFFYTSTLIKVNFQRVSGIKKSTRNVWIFCLMWRRWESNPRPLDCQSSALAS